MKQKLKPNTARRAKALCALAVAAGALPCVAQRAGAPARAKSAQKASQAAAVQEMALDGMWSAGLDRVYDRTVKVPGLAGDPAAATKGTLWYKRSVTLPHGEWTEATLTLKGARFAPRVYVDGVQVSEAEGGMAATTHRFALRPGARVLQLEIALRSLAELDPADASYVPKADQWRGNDSSYLWDSVVLRLHGPTEVERVTATADLARHATLGWDVRNSAKQTTLRFRVEDLRGKTLAEKTMETRGSAHGETTMKLPAGMEPWSPEHPHVYRLVTEAWNAGKLSDVKKQSFGYHEFRTRGVHFELNGRPYTIRMGTVVWHRWTRDPEAKRIAWDAVWFEHNVVAPMKARGANALRFHLGLPPEELLDLCDRDGLAVQMEWPFFHGISASEASMREQWKAWVDTAMRHPSVLIMHPWNETTPDQLVVANKALQEVLASYPPVVVSHRDVTPLHRYWWSLFENLGLYYDSAEEFGTPVVVDEFGGDYLDEQGNPGAYPAVFDTFLRFLGRGNTREERLRLQADANGKVAEYWRRLGVAGISPFCILSSPADGNTWFLGPLDVAHPKRKPVWDAVSAAWSEQSVSLELWNRNFAPGERISAPLWFFNDGERAAVLRATVTVRDEHGTARMPAQSVAATVPPAGRRTVAVEIPLPDVAGEWEVEAQLEQAPGQPPVVSRWHVRTFVPQAPQSVRGAVVGVAENEQELRTMLRSFGVRVVALSDPAATVLAGSRATWDELCGDGGLQGRFGDALRRGVSVVLLDVGPRALGTGYASEQEKLRAFEEQPNLAAPKMLQVAKLFDGLTVSFREAAEPESAVQPAVEPNVFWSGIPHGGTWLWNGLRGGLIVPAAEMKIEGLSGAALVDFWKSRGAEPQQMMGGSYYAYELAGTYAFSHHRDDGGVEQQLRAKVKFLVSDAPALASVINPNGEIKVTDLAALYRNNKSGGIEKLDVLVNAGKGLALSPVVKVSFAPGSGRVVLSQLLTEGRLLPEERHDPEPVYGLRYDPVAVQAVLNLLAAAVK